MAAPELWSVFATGETAPLAGITAAASCGTVDRASKDGAAPGKALAGALTAKRIMAGSTRSCATAQLGQRTLCEGLP
ncbi:hypothetical protein ARTHRO8AJ_440155 [Arthrobacter sp. 8AJ]|nr:hypothetical protein ARTHRO8AJ_440155 [Arthrobacter sp. 8AJ]